MTTPSKNLHVSRREFYSWMISAFGFLAITLYFVGSNAVRAGDSLYAGIAPWFLSVVCVGIEVFFGLKARRERGSAQGQDTDAT
jgi:hypothetical protein